MLVRKSLPAAEGMTGHGEVTGSGPVVWVPVVWVGVCWVAR
ncbi:MAG TPA: hypothetical protein VF734_13740 [Pseudonocardiaceae bacterium]